MISARAARKVECQSSACDSSRPLPESYLDVPSTLNSLECERMSTSAVVNLTDATRQEPVRDELWKNYQALKKSHGRGTAKWRSEWEVTLSSGRARFTSLETSGRTSPWRKELFFTGTFHAVLSMGLQICRVLTKSIIARRQVAPFVRPCSTDVQLQQTYQI